MASVSTGADGWPAPAEPLPPVLTPREAAAYLRVSPRTLWGWTKAGRVKALRLPGTRLTRYAREDLQVFVQACRAPAEAGDPATVQADANGGAPASARPATAE